MISAFGGYELAEVGEPVERTVPISYPDPDAQWTDSNGHPHRVDPCTWVDDHDAPVCPVCMERLSVPHRTYVARPPADGVRVTATFPDGVVIDLTDREAAEVSRLRKMGVLFDVGPTLLEAFRARRPLTRENDG